MRNWAAAMLVLAGLGITAAPAGTALAATTSGQHAAASTATATGTGHLREFKTEAEAKSQCGSGGVAWANTRTHVLHDAGTQYFGKTKHGAYVCKNMALGAGYHEPGHKKG